MELELALDFDGVTKTFGTGSAPVTALSDIRLQIPTGKISGLIGPDGAGKTTLMRLVTGLLQPDSGSRLQVLGMDVTRQPLQVQSLVGYMPQRFGLYEDLSVQENLDLYADLQGVEQQQRAERYRELMHMTALAPFTRRLAGQLSGGMKQKLGLACTLLGTPRLLLLDEPTAGVDPVSRRELWEIINRMVKEKGVTVILSTAYLDEAERCENVILMNEGRVLDEGVPDYYSQSVRGRTYHVTSTTLSRRNLLTRLRSVPAVLDATIDNEQIRVVTHETEAPDLSTEFSGDEDLRIEAAEPIFEDAFIARLAKEQTVKHSELNLEARSVSEQTVIEVNRVQKRFGNFYAVKDVSFNVQRGEVFGLLGANGAGKSTTFRMLCGLLPVTAGEVNVAGHDLRRAAAHARSRLGYMAQRFSLYSNLTINENLNFFASAYSLETERRKQRIEWALETFELTEYANSRSGDLPLGYKQRLALSAALLHEPDILFLDEPTSGVDPLARREFWYRIDALAEAGVTVLVTTHFMAEADHCDRLVIMAEGEVLAQGTPTELKARFLSDSVPSPTMEDAFIGLIEEHEQAREDAA